MLYLHCFFLETKPEEAMGAYRLRWQGWTWRHYFQSCFHYKGDLKERVSISPASQSNWQGQVFLQSGFFGQDSVPVLNPCQAWFGHLGPLCWELRRCSWWSRCGSLMGWDRNCSSLSGARAKDPGSPLVWRVGQPISLEFEWIIQRTGDQNAPGPRNSLQVL